MKTSDITSIRFKLYVGAGIFLFGFFIYYQLKNFLKQDEDVNFTKGTVIFLYSGNAASKLQPPYCDVGVLDKNGFISLTNDEFFDNSPSYNKDLNAVFFESKRKSPILGLSEESKLYMKFIPDGGLQEVDLPQIESIYDPNILYNTDSLLVLKEELDSVYLRVYNRYTNQIKFSKTFNKSALFDYYVSDPNILIYDYNRKMTDPLKIQLFNFRLQKDIKISDLVGKIPVNASTNGGFYLIGQKEKWLEIYELNPEVEEIKILDKIDQLSNEVELVSVISPRHYLMLNYQNNKYKLVNYNNGEKIELFSSNFIGDVKFIPN